MAVQTHNRDMLSDYIFSENINGLVFYHELTKCRYTIHEYSLDNNLMKIDLGDNSRLTEKILPHLHDILVPTLTKEDLRKLSLPNLPQFE